MSLADVETNKRIFVDYSKSDQDRAVSAEVLREHYGFSLDPKAFPSPTIVMAGNIRVAIDLERYLPSAQSAIQEWKETSWFEFLSELVQPGTPADRVKVTFDDFMTHVRRSVVHRHAQDHLDTVYAEYVRMTNDNAYYREVAPQYGINPDTMYSSDPERAYFAPRYDSLRRVVDESSRKGLWFLTPIISSKSGIKTTNELETERQAHRQVNLSFRQFSTSESLYDASKLVFDIAHEPDGSLGLMRAAGHVPRWSLEPKQ